MSLSKAPYWFDGHYWCAQALQALGHTEMAVHLRDYLRSFLVKFQSYQPIALMMAHRS